MAAYVPTALSCLHYAGSAGRWTAQVKRGNHLYRSRLLRKQRPGQLQAPGALNHRRGPAARPQARFYVTSYSCCMSLPWGSSLASSVLKQAACTYTADIVEGQFGAAEHAVNICLHL